MKFALFVAPAVAVAVIVVLYPFFGLVLLALLSQLDALANLLSQALPVSVFKLLTFMTLAGVVVNSFAEPRHKRLGPDEPALRFAVLFALVIIVALPFAENLSLGLTSTRRYLSVILLFYLACRLTVSWRHLEILVLCIVGSTFISAVVVIWDSTFGGNLLSTQDVAVMAQWQGISRSAGASDYNPTTAAIMLLAGTILCLILCLKVERWRLIAGLTVLVGTAATVLSFARSAAVAGVLVVLWLGFEHRKHRHFPPALLLALALAALGAFFVPSDYWERLSTLLDFNSDRTLWRRLSYNLIGVELLAENPLLGVGPGNFPHHYSDEANRYFRGVIIGHPRRLHNTYLEVAAELGLMGLGTFLAILLTTIRGLLKVRKMAVTSAKRGLSEALLYSYVSFLIASLFMPNEYNKYLWLLTGLAVAAARLARQAERSEPIEA